MVEDFPKAPITEALIDIRAQLPDTVSLPDLEKLHNEVKAEYPDKKTRNLWEEKVEVEKEGKPHSETHFQQLGYLFTKSDGTQAVQYRLDGFTFNRFRPYTRWEDICPQARSLWEIYKTAVRPVLVTRLAVRYINSIEIPSKNFDYDDYFTSTPRVPQGLPQLLEHFFLRTVIPFPEQAAKAVVIQTPSDKQDPVNTAILLDIDVFEQVSLAPGDDRIWGIFGKLREIKNELFLRSVTEKTKELFR